ncbi:MAG: hypothetical protein GF308_06435 [Candidatus Heimdallarchaeota archaeon]|nr:hypothetical protein [Candidatus Heimdallarchaeota archaeon]
MVKNQKNREDLIIKIWGKSCYKCHSQEEPIIIERENDKKFNEMIIMCSNCHFAMVYMIINQEVNFDLTKTDDLKPGTISCHKL